MEEMIRILIVDDERIVRKGIVGLIPWEKYGMKVVGEAGSGEEALAFLQTQEVDLLCTDLEMPGMSGLELIRKVRFMKPTLQIVVLTMHQDFEYIQQVLRLGVMDYLTKAQVEEENMDSVMEHIAQRYTQSRRKSELYEERCEYNEICVICSLLAEERSTVEGILAKEERKFYGVRDGWYIIKEPWEMRKEWGDALQRQTLNIFYLKLTDCQKITYAVIGEAMELYGKEIVFREYTKERAEYEISLRSLLKETSDSKTGKEDNIGKTLNELIEMGMQMEFITEEVYRKQFLEELREASIRAEEMPAILYPFNLHWNHYTGYDLNRYFDVVGGFQYWYEWEAWILELCKCVRERIGGGLDDIINTNLIHKAITYLKHNMEKEIALDELLKLTGMGKSHFSKHFKRVTGETFVTYLNDLRIEAAKKYLEETELPIYQIAYQVGYVNERYFRKTFQTRTGEQPRKYRNRIKGEQ